MTPDKPTKPDAKADAAKAEAAKKYTVGDTPIYNYGEFFAASSTVELTDTDAALLGKAVTPQ
jgi:hypothetical protein